MGAPLTKQNAWLSQHNIFFSSEKAIQELAFKQTSFEDTVRRTAPYYLGQASEKPAGKRSVGIT
jgi:nucleoside-diphosphate-sugar epimerase